MNGNRGATPIAMFQKVVAAFNSGNDEANPLQKQNQFFALNAPEFRHALNSNTLNADKFKPGTGIALLFKAKLDGLPHSFHQRIERFSLGMATLKLWNARDEIAIGIALDDHIKLSFFACPLFHQSLAVPELRSLKNEDAGSLYFTNSGGGGNRTRVRSHSSSLLYKFSL